MGKKESDTLSLDEITKTTGRSTGTVAGRLSELCNEQLVERVGKGSYRLTTMGTRVVIKNLMPRVVQLPEKEEKCQINPRSKSRSNGETSNIQPKETWRQLSARSCNSPPKVYRTTPLPLS